MFFNNLFGENNLICKNIGSYLNEYENTYPNYDYELLSKFLSNKTGYIVTTDIIHEWVDLIGNIKCPLVKNAKEILEELKNNKKEIILLTNWFSKSQEKRLINSGLRIYFDEIIDGDFALKPNKEAFIRACKNASKEDCIMIGDSYHTDIKGARDFGITTLYFTDKEVDNEYKINDLIKIKEWI